MNTEVDTDRSNKDINDIEMKLNVSGLSEANRIVEKKIKI